ncbi:MFS transporter [Blastomyces dermatitidis ER-3]|uniref:MFS transporter n=3 Tax=Blastomyces TaxID=229219 RepID=A0A179UZ51_BLAGS|nr:MFS transporter [Blastomyces gilchristii SLH14081]XP_045276859.1 MFS transporter [Blastomyces dermatitidis ER-3]EGE83680.2 MFS transporter [Blastomyces dermatitidis ATCC 18188]EQL30331.1 hypothetical protein BDFG_07163 [Blastomyces dermatitidis ATCC 26199]EEQ90051.2 MFS transporter [Blastomyces dermatitidis ER-3]OAT12489.1 MFS transporter [Blastomyces gilchristii SLH14081]
MAYIRPDPPNGGVRAWSVVVGSFLLQMSSFGYLNTCGTFQYYYQSIMLPSKNSSQLAWITTLQIAFFFACGPAVGKLVDVYGSRPVIAPFAALAVISLGMLSLCTQYYQVLLAQGVAFGIAVSGTCLPAIVTVSQWFSTKRGLAVGVASCGSSVGGVIFPIMVSRLIKSHGFASAIRWSMVVVGITMLIGILLCDTPFPPLYKLKKLQGDEEAGQPTDRKNSQDIEPGDAESVGSKAKEAELDSPVLEAAIPPINEEENAKGLLSGLLQRKALGWAGFVLGTFFFMWSFLAPFNYLPLMSVASGMSPDLAQYTLTVTNAGSMFGRVGLGAVSDKMGAFNVMCIVTTFTATTVLGFWLPLSYNPSTVGIFMFGGIYGVASGGFISLIAPCVVSLANSQLENLGITFGLVCIGLAFGALVGLPAMAAVKDSAASHSFEDLIIFTGVVLAVGSVCMVVARYMKGGINFRTKV